MPRNRWRRHRPLFSTPVPQSLDKPKIKWRLWPILWGSLKRTCMVVGAFVLITSLIGLMTTFSVVQKAVPVLPQKMVMFIEFGGDLTEQPQAPGFADPFAFARPTVHDLIRAIDKGAGDPRVQGIFARMEASEMSLAHIQEVRAAIKRFRAAGKFAHIYSTSFGNSLGGYYLAAAFDQIWLQPMGTVSITGLNAQIPFVGQGLENIGVQPQFLQRKEYKTAYESFTNKDISPANKEMMEVLIGDMRRQLVQDISADRNLAAARIDALVDQGLFTASGAQASGLVSKADYADVLVADMSEQVTGEREGHLDIFVDFRQYLGHDHAARRGSLSGSKKKEKVALIYAVGAIMPSAVSASGSGAPAFMGGGVAAADEIAPAILEAAEDEDVKAIILRIDSPGGSPTASETILRALERAKAKGKPVIVSMGSAAASGGYWIASNADKIYTSPSTLTGSIGVVGGKVSLQGLWEKLGVNWVQISWGENAGMWSMNQPFSDSEKARMDAMLDQVYDGFVARVAKGRHMPLAEVEKIAKGRVWSGARAVEIGLADELGGMTDALDYAASLAGRDTRNDLDVIVLPKPKSALEQIPGLIGDSGGVNAMRQIFARVMEPLSGYFALAGSSEPYMAYEPLRVE